MDEDMEDFIGDYFTPSKFDPCYEFDASRFFDFTTPESDFEALEAERWFDTAKSYPPSPFVVELNRSKYIPVVKVINSPNIEVAESTESLRTNSDDDIDSEVSQSEEKTEGKNYHNHVAQGILKAKKESMAKSFKPRSSTLMKPTASHLAKQKKTRDMDSSHFWRRSQKLLTKVDNRSLQNLPGSESDDTKRQKIESGYLRKVAHLRHQTLLSHKTSQKVGPIDANSIQSKSMVTIPREPDLETAQRAQRRSFKSKNNCGPSQHAKPSLHTFKARPLNRKILQAPSLPLPKKSTPQLPEFQAFHLKTMERAMKHSSANVLSMHNPDSFRHIEEIDFKRPNSGDALKEEKRETLHKFNASPLNKKEFNFPNDNGMSENPPIELFNKLSLKSKFEANTLYETKQYLFLKGSKENAPSSLRTEFWRCPRNLNQCWNDIRIPEFGHQPNMNRYRRSCMAYQ